MKRLFGTTVSGLMLSAGAAVAGSPNTHWIVTTPSADNSTGPEGALILLLMIGAVIMLNNGTTTRNTQQTGAEQDANDDDVIMKF